MKQLLSFFLIGFSLLAGCDLAKPQNKAESMMPNSTIHSGDASNAVSTNESNLAAESTKNVTQTVDLNVEKVEQNKTEMNQTQEKADVDLDSSISSESSESNVERVKADVGAGKKGHYNDGGGEKAMDILTVPISTLFRSKEMAAYRIQVPQAMQLYKAQNDGKGPATHELFMEEIIRAQNIKLPELPDGQKYVYDPELEELMIEKPRNKQE
ncbi:MAG: hypothetical protein ACRCUY_05425 [Thermoguttaceae bacterium]